MAGKSNAVYELITNQIVELLERGTVPWRQSWTNGPAVRSYQGRAYRGINLLILSAVAAYRGLRGCWLTYEQARKLGGHVRKGERGVQVVLWRWIDEKDEKCVFRAKSITDSRGPDLGLLTG